MSNYNGRKAPNVSQYIANLNTIPSEADLAAQENFAGIEDDLAMFTNTQFFDFDMGESVNNMPGPVGMGFGEQQKQQQRQNNGHEGHNGMNFVNQPQQFQFPTDFAAYTASHSNHASPHGLPPTPPNGMVAYPPAGQIPTSGAPSHPSFVAPQTGEKRTSSAASLPTPADLEEASRAAAEEDKRRRNTAASARFRVKKKQREQALEKTAREMGEKVSVLEARVGQLEMENRWLKGLITEKGMKGFEMPKAGELKGKEVQSAEGRSTETRTDGVGTEGEGQASVDVEA